MLRLFLGYDPRESIGLHVFIESLIHHSRVPVAITLLSGPKRDGSNAFTYSRFLVPFLCDFQGMAIWLDGSDMLMRADIRELAALYDDRYAVQVVKHEYKTLNPRKYIGTEMEAPNEDYPAKNWSSLIMWNCGHRANRVLGDHLSIEDQSFYQRLQWLRSEEIGGLPLSWNVLIGEPQQAENAKIAHFTLGIPAIQHYRNGRYAEEWRAIQGQVLQQPAARKPTALNVPCSI